MIGHLDNNNLLCDNQHGFRAGRSCLAQLLHHFDDILESLGNDTDSDAIYLDFAKAFDKVDHKLLLKKLEIYGFHPKVVHWIRSFLSNRTQYVVVDGHKSLKSLIISGVPQGTARTDFHYFTWGCKLFPDNVLARRNFAHTIQDLL